MPAHSPLSPAHNDDTYLYAPAELDWFRHAAKAEKPDVVVVFEAAESRTKRPWWQGLLEDLA